MYKGSFSDWAPVNSGVPRSSVLGLLLFNIFINDINNLASNALLFADDAVLYKPINPPSEEYILQSDLTQLERWSQIKWNETER